MVREIRIYVEGGGDSRYGKNAIRQGFHTFLDELIIAARAKRIRWNLIACGSRNSAFDDFKRGVKTHGNAFNILLVDSEGPVMPAKSAVQHLEERDKWTFPPGVEAKQIHLMVEMMEAWFIADLEALKLYYGQGFNENAIPKRINVEELTKDQVINTLQQASRHTQKGEYAKIKHGSDILQRVNPQRVREHAPHCDRFFNILNSEILA